MVWHDARAALVRASHFVFWVDRARRTHVWIRGATWYPRGRRDFDQLRTGMARRVGCSCRKMDAAEVFGIVWYLRSSSTMNLMRRFERYMKNHIPMMSFCLSMIHIVPCREWKRRRQALELHSCRILNRYKVNLFDTKSWFQTICFQTNGKTYNESKQ